MKNIREQILISFVTLELQMEKLEIMFSGKYQYRWYDYSLKGTSSMEEHLLYKQEDGGSIPSCPNMTKYMIKLMTKYMTK